MRTINSLLPLRHRCLESRLLLTFAHQLAQSATAVNRIVGAIDAFFGARLTLLTAESGSSEFIECEVVRVYDNTVVLCGTSGGDEAAVDFLGYAFGRAG